MNFILSPIIIASARRGQGYVPKPDYPDQNFRGRLLQYGTGTGRFKELCVYMVKLRITMSVQFSDYIIFLDHNLHRVNRLPNNGPGKVIILPLEKKRQKNTMRQGDKRNKTKFDMYYN